jgi:hypothetical protein
MRTTIREMGPVRNPVLLHRVRLFSLVPLVWESTEQTHPVLKYKVQKVPGSSRVPAPPWVGSRSPDGWDQIPYRPGGWVLHQPPWSFGL